jgi:hypothetical protein
MEKRDYIESMIEQMGLFLKRLLSDLIKDIGTESIEQTISSIEELFENEFKISISELVYLSENDFNNFVSNHKFKEKHLEDLSELIFKLSFQKNMELNKSKLFKEKAINLLNMADSVSNSYSIDRINKKNIILNS